MTTYISDSLDQSFSGYTLVLPTLSIGNVGQLAIDLIVHTFGLSRVGYLDCPYVLPVIGNDTFTVNQGVLAINLEVFVDNSRRAAFLQQRAPVIQGKQSLFVEDILKWYKEAGFSNIVLLNSFDAGQRYLDDQLQGSQLRFIETGGSSDTSFLSSTLLWKTLEAGAQTVDVLKGGTVSDKLYNACMKENIRSIILILFCSEGNNIPEGTEMAQYTYQYLIAKQHFTTTVTTSNTITTTATSTPVSSASLKQPITVQWRSPPSWKLLFSEGPFDQNLFM